nr:glycosyltransferase family 25 protein [Rubricella aquisinus]
MRGFVISLDRAAHRMPSFQAAMGDQVRITRINAMDGQTLTDVEITEAKVSPRAKLTANEVACCLSHRAAWDAVAAQCEADEYALVFEDDARFIHGPGAGLAAATGAARAAGAGLVFLNISAVAQVLGRPATREGLQIRDIPTIHREGAAAWLKLKAGWGAYGYLISGAKAAELSAAWAQWRCHTALDWQMFLMAFPDPAEVQPFWSYRRGLNLLRAATAPRPSVPAHVCTYPLIETDDYGLSSIDY